MALPGGIGALRLDAVALSGFDSSSPPPAAREEFTLTLDDDSIIHADLRPGSTSPWNVASDLPDPADRTGALNFRFQTASASSTENDAFRIASLTFELIPQAVPEPAALGLFGLGLAGLAITARRRKAA